MFVMVCATGQVWGAGLVTSDSEEDASYLALAERADQSPPVPSLELGPPQ